MSYYFGIYHWRRRGKQLLAATLLVLAGAFVWRRGSRWTRLVGLVLVGLGVARSRDPLSRTLDPPPWHLDTTKYERLASGLDLESAETLLDVGTGTGRSLVGMANEVPGSVAVTAVDVFDDRVILGNGPALTKHNSDVAGLDPRIVRGDAARLPVATDSHDVVTFCRVLHDLPDETTADDALTEAARILEPGGRLGVIELPVTHDGSDAPEQYWRTRIEAAGFAVDHTEWIDQYLIVHATRD